MSADEACLVNAARAGDRGAFATLVDRHRPQLLASCRRMAGAGDVAEEAAQEAVLQALLGLDRLREPARFGAWLVGIGLNVCRHLLRSRPAPPWQPEAASPDPQELAEAAELVARVREAVAALPAGQRRAVTLYYLAGLSQREVAAALGIQAGAVKGRLHKARQALRRRLAEFEEADIEEDEMTQSELVEVRVADVVRRDGRNVVVLEEVGGDRRLHLWIGPYEADFLAVHLEDLEMMRPLTYAFAARLLEAAGGTLEEVRISRLADETFYAEAVVASGGATRTVDARPSDALNLAVLLRRPVRVAREVLDAAPPASGEPVAPVAPALSATDIVDELLARLGPERPSVRRRS
ncbi:MAG: sigma-70 family RNA polymerase sigma factor [Chloroflexi bacterium]|nr:MAG: sigma-70 family RNA polymerase sigma factor [Chloroflexota bacterium]